MERKGICRNVGACSMANKVQIITDDDAEFICSECESELEKVVEKAAEGDDEELKKKRQKRLISIGVLSIILLAIIGGIIAMSGSGEETPKQEPVTVVPVDSDSIKAAQMAAENQRLKDSLAAVEAANAKKQEQPTEKPAAAPAPTPKPAKPAASGSKNLGYATFKGSWPNDVNGRMEFKSSHVIDSKDPKGRVAEAGDYVIGEWADGHLVQGIWYGADNQVKGSVIIGR